ncbi:MAG: hypothetical protein ACPGYV_13520, partial [Phycisphaeraceae bacterium]
PGTIATGSELGRTAMTADLLPTMAALAGAPPPAREIDGVSLAADVTDLAHHGSFVELSPRWLSAVSPGTVLQSSGPRRADEDRWAALLSGAGVRRLRTSELGMVELRIDASGAMDWRTHRRGTGD